jgi:ABC-type sugar transport system ATPase subunit
MRRAGLDPRTPYRDLSQPRRELVEIARALASRPRLLILDEATTRVGDPERLFELLERLNRDDGLAVVMITHRLREIRRLSQRVVVLRDGRLAGELDGSEMTDDRITSLMVGRELGPHLHHARLPHHADRIVASGVRVHPSCAPIELSVRRGEILGVAGLAGSGRTALLRSLAGLRRHGGSVHVDGEPLRDGDVRAALAAGVALVPEDRIAQGVFPSLSVSRNVALARHRGLRPVRRRDERELTRPFVGRLAIRTASLDTPVRALSGGNQQKVVLARTLLRTPRVLLLDEPTRGIDIGGKRDVYDAIAQLADAGTAIVVASSELPELLTVCDRILVLHRGEAAGVVERRDFSEEAVVVLSLGGTAP